MICKARVDVMFWPEDPEEGVAEKPIAIGVFSDALELRQGKHAVLVQLTAVDEFCKALKAASKVERS